MAMARLPTPSRDARGALGIRRRSRRLEGRRKASETERVREEASSAETKRQERGSKRDATILAIAWPAALSLAADPLLAAVDTAYVGRIGVDALGALGADAAVVAFAFTAFSFLGTATTPEVAQACARDDGAAATRAMRRATITSVACGTALAVAMGCGAGAAADAMGVDGSDMRTLAVGYLQARAMGAPAALFNCAAQGAFRGMQDTKTPLAVALASNGLNAVLDPWLIFTLGRGVEGAGEATAIAEWCAAITFSLLLWRRNDVFGDPGDSKEWREVDGNHPEEDGTLLPHARKGWEEWKEFAGAGGAVMMRTVALLGTRLFATSVATHLGAAPVAAHQVAMQFWNFASFFVDSLAIAGQSLVAVSIGMGDMPEAREVSKRLMQIGLGLGIGLSVLYGLGSSALPQAFTDDKDVLMAFRDILPVLVLMQPLNALVYVLDGVLVGTKDYKFLAVAMLISCAATVVILEEVGPYDLGLWGVWVGLAVLMGGRLATLAYRYYAPSGPLALQEQEVD
uniref:Protein DETOXIFICATION n=1 Tax=Picocystis salinarum TaxID=88271 RepID=A0A7S3UFM4_9CHLO